MPDTSKPWVLAAAIVGSSMAFIDGTVVNVALPAIQRDLRATAFQAQWVVESYALFLAALLLVGGVARRPLRAPAHLRDRRRALRAGLGRLRAVAATCSS